MSKFRVDDIVQWQSSYKLIIRVTGNPAPGIFSGIVLQSDHSSFQVDQEDSCWVEDGFFLIESIEDHLANLLTELDKLKDKYGGD